MPPWLDATLAAAALAHLAAVAALTATPHHEPALPRHRPRRRPRLPATLTVSAAVFAGAGAGVLWWEHAVRPLPQWQALTLPGALCAAVAVGALASRSSTPVGAATWTTWWLFAAVSGVWGAWFLLRLHLHPLSAALAWTAAALTAVTVPSAVVQAREGWEPLLRAAWHRPRGPRPSRPGARRPRVCIQVPTHAEPPEVVIRTLNALAALDYPSFYVLVIDNNTADEMLWRPVEEHCRQLGPRFRFVHVDGVTGAKAGALNWSMPLVPKGTDVVGVVDADYVVRPDWLWQTVGHFEDESVGFVQAPHAYRGMGTSRFQRWADTEYSVFFRSGMVSLNEHGAGLTVGTMSLIRLSALRQAGGWAEWCLTEDSELAIRVHAVGYESVYLTEPMGRGLIPPSFEGYRKQRFRWTYGPVQELRHHLRMFLPRRAGGVPGRLSARQRLHHLNHGLDVACIGLRALALPLSGAAAVAMTVFGDRVPMPFALWLAASATLAGSLVMRWLVFSRVVRTTLARAIGAQIAFAALTHVITAASLRAVLGRPAVWHRTSKFTEYRRGWRAISAARAETVIGAALLTAGTGLAAAGSGALVTMLGIGLALRSLAYFAAPLLAVLADQDLPLPAVLPAGRPRRHVAAGGLRARSTAAVPIPWLEEGA